MIVYEKYLKQLHLNAQKKKVGLSQEAYESRGMRPRDPPKWLIWEAVNEFPRVKWKKILKYSREWEEQQGK